MVNIKNQATIVTGGKQSLCNYLDKLETFGVSGHAIIAIMPDPAMFYTVVYKYYREISPSPKDILTEEDKRESRYT